MRLEADPEQINGLVRLVHAIAKYVPPLKRSELDQGSLAGRCAVLIATINEGREVGSNSRRDPAAPGIMVAMNAPSSEWITVAGYENLPGCLQPMAAVRA